MQYTLYIRKDINEKFKDEKEKSVLVNILLDRHYRVTPEAGHLPQQDLETVVKRVFPKAEAFCKNGHPIPDGRDKCLGKGCKYS